MAPVEDDTGAGAASTTARAGLEQLELGGASRKAESSARHEPPDASPAEREVLIPRPPSRPPPDVDGAWPEQEFFIPVHGEVRLRPSETKVADHPAFQRLGHVFQLGQTSLVYRGATHMRLEHALGALHVAQLMIDALARNCRPAKGIDPLEEWRLAEGLRPDEVALTRLGALLHDVGHLPAGHTLEDELGILPAHDADERLTLILDRREWCGASHTPTLRELIDNEYAGFASSSGLRGVDGQAASASHVLALLVSKDHAKDEPPADCRFRLQVCRDIIGNTICADLLDYLHRDWLHLGKPRSFEKRLLGYMEIREPRSAPDGAQLVINLRSGHRLRTDAVTAILDLLESRYQLQEIALFHRTKCCAAAMLGRLVAELAELVPHLSGTLPEQLLERSDDEMLVLFDELLASVDPKSPGEDERGKRARGLVRRLRLRQLHKELVAYPEFKLADATRQVQQRFAGKDGAVNRLSAMRLLEADFGMPPCSLAMYCPPGRMNFKIADVQILVHGDVHTLSSFEEEQGDYGVTGGHLRAQRQRFRRLWRVAFAIDPAERDRLDKLNLLDSLGRAIDLCVLRREHAASKLDDSVRSLAQELATREGSPLHGGLLKEPDVAARGHAMTYYPGGAPSLLTCVGR